MIRTVPGNAERGIALIAVLWLVTLLTLLATAAVAISTSRLRIVSQAAQRVQAVLVADAAIRVAIAELASAQSAQRFAGGSVSMSVLDESVNLRVDLERGRLNVNAVDSLLLEAFFVAHDWTVERARIAVARIEDWRDSDEEPRRGGAESRDYEAAGLKYRPRNAPFEAVEEIRQVLGFEAFQVEWLDSFTVFGPATTVSDVDAVLGVREALNWADSHEVGGRRWLDRTRMDGAMPNVSIVAEAVMSGGLLRLTACAHVHEQVCRAAIVRLTGDHIRRAQVFSWR